MLSLAKVTPEMGAHYFSKEDYYSQEEGPARPEFFGKGIQFLGIKKDFNQLTFQELLQGKSPSGFDLRQKRPKVFQKNGVQSFDGVHKRFKKSLEKIGLDSLKKEELSNTFLSANTKQHLNKKDAESLQEKLSSLTTDKKARKIISKYVAQVSKKNDRAGLDLTFSAPKSVSIATLIGEDKELLNAHKKAVKFTLSYIEKNYIGTRIGAKDNRKFSKTNNMVASLFHHGTSRLQDPQLHTHCIIMNTTLTPNGKWKAIHNDEIYKDSVLLGTIYQKKLADLAQDLGYEITPDKNGTFQLSAYKEKDLEYFSKRSNQLKEVIESHGMTNSATSKRIAVLKDRQAKAVSSPSLLKDIWKAKAKKLKIMHPKKSKGIKRKAINWSFASQHLEEKDSIWSNAKLLLGTLLVNIKNGKVETILRDYEEKSEAKIINSKGQRIGLTNNKTIETESKILHELKQGRAKFKAIDEHHDCNHLSVQRGFTQGQTDAFKLSMTNKDFLSAWVGVAGSGKSYALKDVQRVAKENGFEVTGLGPDGNSAKELSKSTGIKAHTIDRFLLQNPKENHKQKLWIVDEAGKVSSKKMLKLIEKAKKVKDTRILLVGDTRQIGAVEAGSPFSLLLNNNIVKAELLEHRRQKNLRLKRAVEMASKKELIEKSVQALGSTKSYKTKKIRIANIAKEYLSLPKKERQNTLILTDINKDRIALISEIRKNLKKEGALGSKNHEVLVLKQRDLTSAQKRLSWSFNPGDIIVPFKNCSLKKGHQYSIEKVNKRTGQLTLSDGENKTLISPNKMEGFSVYTQETLDISEGDKLQFTKNTNGRSNREIATVKSISDGKIHFKEFPESLDLKERQYLDHALVQTTYGSQGQTAENVLYLAESNVSRETWYVGISRAKNRVSVVTDNIEKLSSRVTSSNKKLNALDFEASSPFKEKRGSNPDYEINL